MITHYGLFWSERDVFWGEQGKKKGGEGKKGEFLGREKIRLLRRGAPNKIEKEKANDFKKYIGIYCLYANRQLLYIGEAGLGNKGNLFNRIKQHRNDALADQWDSFSWFGRAKCEGETPVKDALKQLEAISIAIVNPGFNRQSGAFAGAKQVFQVPHDDAEGDFETKLNRIADQTRDLDAAIKKLA